MAWRRLLPVGARRKIAHGLRQNDQAAKKAAALQAAEEQTIAAAHVALYRYKRQHPDDTDVSMLEHALESAKRACRRG